MICKQCGAENPENARFCGDCGTRLDGKKPCPFCGELNSETTTYCIACGKRIDGKTVCECGTVHDRAFCTNCGKPALGENTPVFKETAATAVPMYEVKPVSKEKKGIWEKVAFWLDKSQSIAFLVGACFAMLFVFFIGVTIMGETDGIFYYFGEVYKDVKEICQVKLGNFSVGWRSTVGYTYAVIGTISMALTLVLTLIFGCLAIYSYVKNFRNVVSPNRHKWAIATVVTYFGGTLIFKVLANVSAVGISATFNGATESGFVLCGIFLLLGCALGVAKQGKVVLEKKTLTKYIVGVVGVIFGAIALGFTGSVIMDISSSGTEVSLPLWAWALSIVAGIESASSLYVSPDFEIAIIGLLVATAVLVITTFIIGKNLATKIRNFADGGNDSGLSIAIVGLVFAVALLVLIIVANDFAMSMIPSKMTYSIGGAIVLVVFAALNVVASIVQKVLCSQKQQF